MTTRVEERRQQRQARRAKLGDWAFVLVAAAFTLLYVAAHLQARTPGTFTGMVMSCAFLGQTTAHVLPTRRR